MRSLRLGNMDKCLAYNGAVLFLDILLGLHLFAMHLHTPESCLRGIFLCTFLYTLSTTQENIHAW